MQLIPTAIIPDVVIVEPKVFGDERGFFMEPLIRMMSSSASISLGCEMIILARVLVSCGVCTTNLVNRKDKLVGLLLVLFLMWRWIFVVVRPLLVQWVGLN